ncbi:hypothetical protein H5410_004992, partial [Solanum commersonii]
MNAYNKTQFTYAMINCVLKDSSCDTPLPKILMLAILATCASSRIRCNAHNKKEEHNACFTHIFALIFQSTSIRLAQHQKGVSKAFTKDECK